MENKQKFEFIFYINDVKKLITLREFTIKHFNPKAIKSLEIKEMMDRLVGVNNGRMGSLGLIPASLKERTEEYMWQNYNPNKVYNPVRNITNEKDDMYYFEINMKGDENTADKLIARSSFPASPYLNSSVMLMNPNATFGDETPKIRYRVDIFDLIPEIMSEIRSTLTSKDLTTTYEGITL